MNTQTQFTRSERLNNECTHDQYYSQFVTDSIKNIVRDRFGIKQLKSAFNDDKSFNSIPLIKGDALAELLKYENVGHKMRELGDYPTLAGLVCVLKYAARHLINE